MSPTAVPYHSAGGGTTPTAVPYYSVGGGTTPSSALKVVYGKANELGQLVAHTPLTGTITAIKKHVATVGVHNVVTMALFLRLLVPRVTPKIKGALLKLAHAVSTWTAMQSRRIYAMLHMLIQSKLLRGPP